MGPFRPCLVSYLTEYVDTHGKGDVFVTSLLGFVNTTESIGAKDVQRLKGILSPNSSTNISTNFIITIFTDLAFYTTLTTPPRIIDQWIDILSTWLHNTNILTTEDGIALLRDKFCDWISTSTTSSSHELITHVIPIMTKFVSTTCFVNAFIANKSFNHVLLDIFMWIAKRVQRVSTTSPSREDVVVLEGVLKLFVNLTKRFSGLCRELFQPVFYNGVIEEEEEGTNDALALVQSLTKDLDGLAIDLPPIPTTTSWTVEKSLYTNLSAILLDYSNEVNIIPVETMVFVGMAMVALLDSCYDNPNVACKYLDDVIELQISDISRFALIRGALGLARTETIAQEVIDAVYEDRTRAFLTRCFGDLVTVLDRASNTGLQKWVLEGFEPWCLCVLKVSKLEGMVVVAKRVVNATLERLLGVCWRYWDDAQKDVRRKAKDLLSHTLKLYPLYEPNPNTTDPVTQILTQLLDPSQNSSSLNSKYSMLPDIIPHFGSKWILARYPDFITTLFAEMHHAMNRTRISSVFEAFLISYKNETDINSWVDSWFGKLIGFMRDRWVLCHDDSLKQLPVVTMDAIDVYLLRKIIMTRSEALPNILDRLKDSNVSFSVDLFICLAKQGLANKKVLTKSEFMNRFTNMLSKQNPFDTPSQPSEYYLITTFSLLCRYFTISEIVDSGIKSIFETILKTFLKTGIESSANRSTLSTDFDYFLQTIPKQPSQHETDFINTVYKQVLQNLDANKTLTTTEGFIACQTCLCLLSAFPKHPSLLSFKELPKQLLDVIITCPYELCRLASKDLFLSLSSRVIQDWNELESRIMTQSWELVNHWHTMERMKGVILLQIVSKVFVMKFRGGVDVDDITGVLVKMSTQAPMKQFIKTLLKSLTKQMEVMGSEPLQAAFTKSPCHGVLGCLEVMVRDKEVLNDLDDEIVIECLECVLGFIEIGCAAFQMIQNLVDGYAEEDDDDDEEEELETMQAAGQSRATALSACWRSLRSAAVVITSLFVSIPSTSSQFGIFTERVKTALVKLLFEIRHWGVATASQDSFTKFCQYLSSTLGTQQTISWLNNEFLETKLRTAIMARHDQRYCGLARCVVSILLGAPSSQKQHLVDTVVTKLVKIITDPETNTDERTQMNAIILLKWLQMDTKLGAFISPETCFLVALQGMRRPQAGFSFRGACTQLFCVHLQKFFDETRMNTNMEIEDGNPQVPNVVRQGCLYDPWMYQLQPVSAHDFFAKYRKLSEMLYETLLQGSTSHPWEQSTFAALLLLVQLRNDARIATGSNEMITRFGTVLETLALGHHIAKVREFAARAYAGLLSPDSGRESISERVVDSVSNSSDVTSQNALHGALWILWEMVERFGTERVGLRFLDGVVERVLVDEKVAALNKYLFVRLLRRVGEGDRVLKGVLKDKRFGDGGGDTIPGYSLFIQELEHSCI